MSTTATIDLDQVRTYTDGRLQLFVGMCEKIDLPQIISKHMKKTTGRPSDIDQGVAAMILMAPMAQEGYQPLYQLNEYYRTKDLEGIFHTPVALEEIEDDRFSYFLDSFYAAGCRKIFSEICANALLTYGIQVKSINYDTTSFVMWGDYETIDGTMGGISIDFGHSKARRPDKKQIKLGVGVANGTIVDAKVLSGNMSDKTYNKENIEDVVKLLDQLQVDKTTFYYIADSALFSEEILCKMRAAKMNFITRMPDNINEAKGLIERGVGEVGQQVVYRNAHNKDVHYVVAENAGDYKGHALKYAVVYSTALEPAKVKSIGRKVKAEQAQIDAVVKKYQKQSFACLDDATREIKQLNNKQLAKIAFHKLSLDPKCVEKKRPGRPSQDPSKNETTTEYQLCITYQRDDFAIQERIRKESTFILASNDHTLSAEAMLLEYKTQSSVEKRFQQLKNPQFVNSLYLNTPERVEALAYLILLTIMILSVMEQVVRAGMKREAETVIGTGKKVKLQPTQLMIIRIFTEVITQTYIVQGKPIRRMFTPFNDSQAKILRYLGITESNFAWNT
jgi:transposase